VQQIRGAQFRCAIRLALFVNEQGKVDSSLFAENLRIAPVAKTDGRERSSFGTKRRLVLAQLRDMLATENSPVVAQKYQHCRRRSPERPEPRLAALAIRQRDVAKLAAQGFLHGWCILSHKGSQFKGADCKKIWRMSL